MGQIQNAINAGVGSIIASKGIAEHLQSQAFDAVESQYKEAEKIGKQAELITNQMNENNKKSLDIEKTFAEIEKKSNIEHPRDEKTGRFINKKEYYRRLEMDEDKAYDALRELHKQQDATATQKDMFNARLEMFDKRNALLQKAINRLPAKKRPESLELDNMLSINQSIAVDALKETNKENK